MGTINHQIQQEQTILSRSINEIESTIKLMDEFESYPGYGSPFQTLELKDALRFYLAGEGRFTVTLYITRKKPKWFPEYNSSSDYRGITFTELIKDSKNQLYFSDLSEMIDNGIFSAVRSTVRQYSTKKIPFPSNKKLKIATPYKFHAQHSVHKTGFGDKYYGKELVEIGTKYGDTKHYYISYIKINSNDY